MDQTKNAQHHQKMGLLTAIIIGMNSMIGAGIFMIPEQLQKIVGPAGLITYALVIAAVWCLASSLAYIAKFHPEHGSLYTYVASWGGKKLGFAATTLYCAGLALALGLLTKIVGSYLHSQIPCISIPVLSIITLTLLTLSLLGGAHSAKWGQIILIILTLAPLAVIAALCFSHAKLTNLVPFIPQNISSIFGAMSTVIFGFFGFEAITSLNNLVKNPEKNVSRAITWSVIGTSIVYVLFVFSTFLGLPKELFISMGTLPNVLQAVFANYSWLVTALIWGIIITIMGTIHALIWAISSLIYSLAHVIPIRKCTKKHATLLLAVLVAIASLTLNAITFFFNVTALCITCALSLGSVLPIILKRVPASLKTLCIAYVGLFACILMWFYALIGIFGT